MGKFLHVYRSLASSASSSSRPRCHRGKKLKQWKAFRFLLAQADGCKDEICLKRAILSEEDFCLMYVIGRDLQVWCRQSEKFREIKLHREQAYQTSQKSNMMETGGPNGQCQGYA